MTRLLDTRFSSADSSPGFVLWRATNAWQAAVRAALKPLDLTHVQFVLLASLTWLHTDEPVTQQRLAEHAGTEKMMTSQVVRVLEQRGLVYRDLHPGDGRARVLHISDAGRDLANQAVTVVEDCDRRFFTPLGADIDAFAAMLRRLTA